MTLITLVGPIGAVAQDSPNLLQSKGYDATHNWFSPFDWEHFDAVSGNIMLTFTDLSLPGNAGRQLQFARVFNSNYGVDDQSRWRFGFPGMVMKIIEKQDPPNGFDFQDDIYRITQNTPVFIMADGAEHPTAYMGEPNGPNGYTAAQLRAMPVISGQFYKYIRQPLNSQAMGTLFMPDGTVCHYAPDGHFDALGHPYWTLRDFSDPFGNTVTLTDGTDPMDGTTPIRTVTQDLGNGQSLQVVFRLNPDGNPSTMKFVDGSEDRTWSYEYGPPGIGLHDLQTVTLPMSQIWTFAYDSPTGAISDVTVPTSGHIHYDYTPRMIYDVGHDDDPNFGEEFIGLTQRTMSDGGTPLGIWTLYIGPGHRNDPASVGSMTTPSASVSFSTYATTMLNNVLDGGIGTTEITVLNGAGTVQDERQTYTILPSVDYGNNHWWGTGELTHREITRTEASGSHTYTTTYTYAGAPFGNYHQPSTIVENDNFGLARTTTRTFDYFVNWPYLLARPTSEQVSINNGTPLIKLWQNDPSTGFRTQETIAGITTTFAPDSLGNIGRVTKANQKTTSYTYSFGQVSQITTSEPGYTIS